MRFRQDRSLDYEVLWAMAKAKGEKAAEGLYPESQPGRRRRHAAMVTLREFRAMTHYPCTRIGCSYHGPRNQPK